VAAHKIGQMLQRSWRVGCGWAGRGFTAVF